MLFFFMVMLVSRGGVEQMCGSMLKHVRNNCSNQLDQQDVSLIVPCSWIFFM